jgi:hypothetical protein
MSVTRTLGLHLSLAVIAVLTLGTSRAAAQAAAPGDGLSRFTVIVRGVRIGTEAVDVSRTPTSVRISSVGQLAAPLDLVTTKFEMLYGSDGHPQRMTIEASPPTKRSRRASRRSPPAAGFLCTSPPKAKSPRRSTA